MKRLSAVAVAIACAMLFGACSGVPTQPQQGYMQFKAKCRMNPELRDCKDWAHLTID